MKVRLSVSQFILALLFLAVLPKAEAQALKIHQTYAVPMSHYGQNWLVAYVQLQVQNLAFAKEVEVQLQDAEGTVHASPANYLKSFDATSELWDAYISLPAARATANISTLKVSASLKTGGQSFALSPTVLALGPALWNPDTMIQALMPQKQSHSSSVVITANLRNIAYEKHVVLHWTCDLNGSFSTQALSFQRSVTYGYGLTLSPTPEGFEIWQTSLNMPCPQIAYYLTYEVAGKTFQDGDTEHLYQLSQGENF